MVEGLERFRDHFQAFANQYVLIGGTACDLSMSEAGLGFRATKDLDIVLCLEALNAGFVASFWEFIRAGKYERREHESGQRRFYRFQRPGAEEYPAMLELFCRAPDMLPPSMESHLTPIPVDADISSLSAILLDETYYAFLQSGRIEIQGVPIVRPEYLIPLKAHAWLDLTRRKKQGEKIDRRSISKHRNDVFRLFQVLEPELRPDPASNIKEDLLEFLAAMEGETLDLKTLRLRSVRVEDVLVELKTTYGL